MKRLGLIFVVFFVASIEMRGQTNDSPKWVQLKPSEFAESSVYQARSEFGGTRYETNVYGRDLSGVVKWKPGDELPIGISKITSNAKNAFQKRFPQFSQFRIVSVNLVHLPAVDDWIFDVEFNGTDFAKVNEGAFEDKKINVLVLLNGRAITSN